MAGGVALGPVGWLAATLPGDRMGAEAPALANAPTSAQHLPVSIGAYEYIQLLVAVKGLASQGTYALKFGVSVDGAAPTTLPTCVLREAHRAQHMLVRGSIQASIG